MAADTILFKLAITSSQTKYELSPCLAYSKLIDILKDWITQPGTRA